MGKMIGPRKVRAYGDNLKATAVKLSMMPGVQVQDVAEALDIHPFMLSRWRKEYREGRIVSTQGSDIDIAPKLSELQRLRHMLVSHAELAGSFENLINRWLSPINFKCSRNFCGFNYGGRRDT